MDKITSKLLKKDTEALLLMMKSRKKYFLNKVLNLPIL